MMTKKQFAIFLIFIIIIIAHHTFGYLGHYGYDDLQYAKLANDFNKGSLDYNDHFSFRTPVIFLTALSYATFGISDNTSALPAILITILVLYVVFQALKKYGDTTIFIGLSLTTLSTWFIFYADKLMPDIYVALAVIAAIYCIHQYRYSTGKKNPITHGALVSFSLLFGFMSKGTIILIIPLLLFYFIADVVQRKNAKFWLSTIASGIALLSAYFFVTKLVTGDAFKRFGAISGNSYLNPCSYDQQSFDILLSRISSGFFELILSQGIATGFIFVLASLFEKKSLRRFKIEDSLSFWIATSIILLLSSNFMTISFSSYSPMCLDPRHYLFLIPVVSIPASIILNKFLDTKSNIRPIIATTAIIATISFFSRAESFLHLFLPLLILILVYSIVRTSRLHQNLFLIGMVIALSIQPILQVKYARRVEFKKQTEIFKEFALNSSDNVTVITDKVQQRIGNYLNNFNDDGQISILSFDDYRKTDTLDGRRKILFLNWYTQYLSGMNNHDLPYYAKNISEEIKPLHHNEKLNIRVYDMIDLNLPKEKGEVIFQALNTFEEDAAYWIQEKKNITNKLYYEGKTSSRIQEYSATFEYPVDSLSIESSKALIISCTTYCYFQASTESRLIISIEDSSGAYVWEEIEINKYLKAYSNWWPIKYETSINTANLKQNSKIKIFIKNTDEKIGYLDNFDVTISSLNN